MTAPTMPPRLHGNTVTRIISQRVAPIPSAAFLSSCGDGREDLAASTTVMIGMIMMARIRPAVMKPRPPLTGPPKMRPRTGMSPTASATDW